MISIIIPTYNEEKYIGKSLKCFKEKMTIPHEVIISDDKSTDKTVEVARPFADLIIEADIKHQTIAANRNTGAQSAHGDLLVFMDGDSFIENPDEFFTRALKDFENPHIVAVTGAINIFPHVKTFSDIFMYQLFNFVHFIKNNVFHTGESSGKFQMMRREAFEKVGGFPANLVAREDALMFNKLAKIGRTFYDGKLLILHNGRRAHMFGWPKLLSIWMIETFWVAVFKKSRIKEWIPIR